MKRLTPNLILSSITVASWLALLTLGQLQRIQLSPSIAVYVHDIFAVILAGYAVWKNRSVLRFSKKWWGIPIWVLMVSIWIGFGWIMAATSLAEVIRPIFWTVRLITYALASWSVAAHLKHFTRQKWLSVFFAIWIGIGILQYVIFPDTRWLAPLGWDDHYFRLIGTLFDPNFSGLLLVMIGLWWSRDFLRHTAWRSMALIMTGIALGLTFSRASWLALAVASLVLILRKSSLRTIQLLGMGCVVIGVLLGILIAPRPGGEGVKLARTASVIARADASQTWLRELRPYQWLIGRGLVVQPLRENDTFALADTSQVPDSLVVLLISGIGFVGTAIVLWILYMHRAEWLGWPTWLQAMWVAVLIHSLVNTSLFEPFIWCWLLILTFLGRKIRA